MEYDLCDMRFLNLNSSDATHNNSTYLSDVKFNFRNILSDEVDIKYVTCGVLNAQIPVSFYTVNYTNDYLEFAIDGGITEYFTITRGNYNSNSLITELISQFSTLGYVFSITTSKTTGIMTFNYPTHNFEFFGTSTLFKILGFVFGTDYSSLDSSLTADHPLNLLGVKRLKINSNALSTNVYDSHGTSLSSNIASIPVNVPAFGLIDYVNSSNAFPVLKAHTVTYIDIQIFDEDNNLVNFNGINWTITVQLNIYRKGLHKNKDIDLQPVITELKTIEEELQPQTKSEDEKDNIVLPAVDENNNEDDLDFLLYKGEI